LAENGFFAKEMNAGWAEWTAGDLPTHSARVAKGQVRCECSK
jgi:hypothetical protein